MTKVIAFLVALTCTAGAFAASTPSVEDVFQRYWSSYSKKDYAKAAGEVLPADLEASKTALLPLFLAAQASRDKEVQEMVTAFFGRTVGKARETMPALDVFAGLNRLAAAGNPQFFDLLKDAKVSVIFVRKVDADNAEVHYQVTIGSESDTDVEALTRKDGRWWVRASEDPQAVAASLKPVLEKKAAN